MKHFMKKTALLTVILIIAFTTVCLGAPAVNYSYGEEVTPGEIRYIAQIKTDGCYYEQYWGKYLDYSSSECGTACISMALSYLGVDETPEELGDYWIEQGYTAGTPFSTVFYDVPIAEGGHSCDFFTAYEKYESGVASPVIIYFTRELNPYMTGNRHFVMIIGKTEDGKYIAVDPAKSEERTVSIKKNEDGTLFVETLSKEGKLISGTETEAELCSAQYTVSENALSKKPAPVPEPTPTPEIAPEPTPQIAAEDSVITFEEKSTKAEAGPSAAKQPYVKAAKSIADIILKYAS